MKKMRPVLVILIIILVLGLLMAPKYLLKERIETYPDDTIGNTAGNLNNGGYFCEADGVVYFANFYDNGTLYRMTPDESGIRKLNNQTIRFLNAAGSHLYYFQEGNEYYMVKNSWGTANKYNGIWYASKAFVRYKTMNIVVHKDALPKAIKAKLGIK